MKFIRDEVQKYIKNLEKLVRFLFILILFLVVLMPFIDQNNFKDRS